MSETPGLRRKTQPHHEAEEFDGLAGAEPESITVSDSENTQKPSGSTDSGVSQHD